MLRWGVFPYFFFAATLYPLDSLVLFISFIVGGLMSFRIYAQCKSFNGSMFFVMVDHISTEPLLLSYWVVASGLNRTYSVSCFALSSLPQGIHPLMTPNSKRTVPTKVSVINSFCDLVLTHILAQVLSRGCCTAYRVPRIWCSHGVFPDLLKELLRGSIGVVQRCWHDAEDYTIPEAQQADPLMRPLKQGEVGVSFFPSGFRDILPESLFTLVDRIFQPGDLCKRSIDDVCSGIVASVHTEVRLAHSITDEPVEGWKTLSDIERSHNAEVQDYVLYDDWIGQVSIKYFDENYALNCV